MDRADDDPPQGGSRAMMEVTPMEVTEQAAPQTPQQDPSQQAGTSQEQTAATEGLKEAKVIPISKIPISRLIQLDACTRCGECLNWCPVYDQDRREDIIPRTKVRDFYRIIRGQHGLLASLLRRSPLPEPMREFLRKIFGVPVVTEEMVKKFALNLYECSTCGQCQVVCPANIDTVNIWEGLREAVVSAGYGPLPRQMPLVKSVKAYDNPWQQPRQGRTKWIRRAKKEGLLKELPREIKKNRPKILLFLALPSMMPMSGR